MLYVEIQHFLLREGYEFYFISVFWACGINSCLHIISFGKQEKLFGLSNHSKSFLRPFFFDAGCYGWWRKHYNIDCKSDCSVFL